MQSRNEIVDHVSLLCKYTAKKLKKRNLFFRYVCQTCKDMSCKDFNFFIENG